MLAILPSLCRVWLGKPSYQTEAIYANWWRCYWESSIEPLCQLLTYKIHCFVLSTTYITENPIFFYLYLIGIHTYIQVKNGIHTNIITEVISNYLIIA